MAAKKSGPIGPSQYDTEGAEERRDLFGLGDNTHPGVHEFEGEQVPSSGSMATDIATGRVSSDRKAGYRDGDGQ